MKTKALCQIKYWHVPEMDDIELLHGTDINYEYPPHIHKGHSVTLILSGRGNNHLPKPQSDRVAGKSVSHCRGRSTFIKVE
jgi:hypothetical protein